ncbi:fungal-specific transcription factor domain-containing protein [Phaeosphaeria sp. MPI-PUGE-AT-0046c]|nr:fungal-specific transcription factor domain-containing protein [Phaeosphaeria sp. MPI-PUGE-AT-0046c]
MYPIRRPEVLASPPSTLSPYPEHFPMASIQVLRGLTAPETPQRQKTKVTRACDLCKSKKSNRRGLICQYKAAYFRGRPPLPRRYTETASNPSDGVESSEQMDASSFSSALPIVRGYGPIAEELPSGRGSPSLEVAGQYSDPTSGLSFLQRAWRRISNNSHSGQALGGYIVSSGQDQLLNCAGDKPFLRSGEIEKPSLNRGRSLLELYFEVCIATYRILHRPSVDTWCATILADAPPDSASLRKIGNAKAAVVFSVLAVASFHEEKARGDDEASPLYPDVRHSQADQLFTEASRLSEEEQGFPTLESAQSRLVQVLYLLMSSRFNQAWYTFGHALQIISALAQEDYDYIKEQCKRRTFWVAYTLDKYLGVIFGRPQHYHDNDIDQQFPDPVNDEDMFMSGPRRRNMEDCHIDSLVSHAKLAQIAEKISREVYSIKTVPDNVRLAASHRLGAELRSWRAGLPPLLGVVNPRSLIPSFRRQATALKLSYCHAVMLAHRPFLLKNNFQSNEDPQALAEASVAECIAAAQTVLEVVDSMAQDGRLFHAFWWTHYVCFCALVIVYVWTIQESNSQSSLSTERRQLLDMAERCLVHLAEATASNSPSRKYSIILQELRTEAKRRTARLIREQGIMPIVSPPVTGDVPSLSNMDPTSFNANTAQQTWQPLFGSPIDTTTPGLQNFLDDWQTTDWLQLDSSAFATFPPFDDASVNWM